MKNVLFSLAAMGLTEKQALLYQTALRYGQNTLAVLARQSGIKRPTAYNVMDELLKLGLFVTVPKGGRTLYCPTHPRQFVTARENDFREAHQALPALEKLFEQNLSQPKIRFYRGYREVYQFYEEIARSKEIWSLFDPDNFLQLFGHDENRHFFRLMLRHGGRLHDMLPDTLAARKFSAAPYYKANCEARFLPKAFKLSSETIVFDSKIALIRFDTAFAVVIDDPNISTSILSVMKNLWNSLKPTLV